MLSPMESPVEWMMINLTRPRSSSSLLSRRARGVMGRMTFLLPLALPSVTPLASRASSTCDSNRDDWRRGRISCWMETFNSFTSVEKQLVVWCPHLPGRLQVPCKLSLGSQDVSSGNTNTMSSLQDKKMFGGYKTSKNNYWLPLGNAGLLTAKYRFNKPMNTQENEDDERAKYLFHDKSTSSVSSYFCVKRKEVKDHLTPCTLYPLY